MDRKVTKVETLARNRLRRYGQGAAGQMYRTFVREEIETDGDLATEKESLANCTEADAEEIAERIAEVQAGWSPAERARRRVGITPELETAVIPTNRGRGGKTSI